LLSDHRPIGVPAHFDAEAFSALRRLIRARHITNDALALAARRLMNLPAARIPVAPFLPRAVGFIDRFGAHDVFYVLLAQDWICPLLTCDGALARASEPMVRALFVPPTPLV